MQVSQSVTQWGQVYGLLSLPSPQETVLLMSNWIVALPIFNEESHVNAVLDEVLTYAAQVVVVDDGSSDQTAQILKSRDDVTVLTHHDNRGYGAALQTAFDYAIKQGVDAIVTIDCDGQHQPKLIPQMIDELFSDELSTDIVSGSRYLTEFASDKAAPEDRRRINFEITKQLNEKLNLKLTDTFCGFKAYRVSALKKLSITDTGYAMPLQFWVQAACAKLNIVEFPVPRIYLEEERSFGGSLDDARVRMAHYQQVISDALDAVSSDCPGMSAFQGSGV